jgi:hypothetical protein
MYPGVREQKGCTHGVVDGFAFDWTTTKVTQEHERSEKCLVENRIGYQGSGCVSRGFARYHVRFVCL